MTVPLIADIHFDHRLALESGRSRGLRPDQSRQYRRLVESARSHQGRQRARNSLARRCEWRIARAARCWINTDGRPRKPCRNRRLNAVHALEDEGFTNMKVSLKASDVHHAIDAYWLFAHQSNYPLHIGITEAGTAMTGAVKSAIGSGVACCRKASAIRLRVSLAADPVEEVKVGFEILKSLELRHRGINVIACPTCGRVEIDVVRMANELEKKLGHIKTPLNVSVLGCVVNGIGEGKEADIGIAGGEGKGILFKKGKLCEKCPSKS